MLHGQKSCPELNGSRGRLLPLSGTGAPNSSVPAGRVAVRLAKDGKEVAVRLENLRSPHAAATATAEGGASPAAAAPAPAAGASASKPRGKQQQQQQGQASLRKADMLRLLEVEFSKWHTGACLTATNLQQAGMQQHHIRCCECALGGQQVERYVALKRTGPLHPAPLPDSALRLLCLDCYAESAMAAGLPLTDDAVEEFVDATMMGGMEACWQLTGAPRMQWGGQFGSGAMY